MVTTLDDMKEPYRQIEIKIDFGLNAENQVVQKEIVDLVQYDSYSGLLVFDFYNKGIRIDLNGVQIGINFQLPSGETFTDIINDVRVLESRATYFIKSRILKEEGEVIGDVALFKGETQITSNVKFKFNVIKGISAENVIEDEDYPALQSLILQVQEVVDEARVWSEEFQIKDEVLNEQIQMAQQKVTDVSDNGKVLFDTQISMQDQEFDDLITEKNNAFDTKATEINNRFNELYNNIDGRFVTEEIEQKFQDKYNTLEQQYAQDYADIKSTANEIKTTCLKYRIVEEGE